jgi:hypothetical protein
MKWSARFRQFDRRYFAGALGHAGWNVTSSHKVVAWDIDEEGVEIRTYAYRAPCGQIRRFQVDTAVERLLQSALAQMANRTRFRYGRRLSGFPLALSLRTPNRNRR